MLNMPKGGDLHNHLSGATMAEHLLQYADGDHLCINRKDLSAVTGQCPPEDKLETAIQNPSLYNTYHIIHLSMPGLCGIFTPEKNRVMI